MVLNGMIDDEILADGITQYELDKIKVFHEKISTGASYMSLFSIYGLDQSVVKRLWTMYYDFKDGKPVVYDSQLKINTIFKLLLHGRSHEEIIEEGYNDEEIRRAVGFLELARAGAKDRMLMSTLAELTNIPRSSCSHMLKMYENFTEGQGGAKVKKAGVNHPNKTYKTHAAQITAA